MIGCLKKKKYTMFTTSVIFFILLLSAFHCDARKSKSRHQSQMVKAKPDTLGESYKKQGLEVPFDDKEGLGGEPVGNLNGDGGIEGLGGEMQGFPAGMGAGAEPLGAYDRDPQQNYQEGGLNRPRLDESMQGQDGYGGLPMGFSREGLQNGFSQQQNMNPGGDFFEGRSSPYGDESNSFKQSGPFEQISDAENVMGPRQMQMQTFLNPQPSMGESMSNNIDAMDKANVQGDSDVGEMVRARASSPRQEEQPMPGENDSQFMDQRRNPYEQEGEGEPEYRNFKSNFLGIEALRNPETMMGSKRRLKEKLSTGSRRVLKKTKRKTRKWEGFKPLKTHGYKVLQG